MRKTALPAITITFDNGTEFAHHQKIAEALGPEVYFANPYHSWERALSENTNGLIRQFIPKNKTSSNSMKNTSTRYSTTSTTDPEKHSVI